MPSRKRAVSAAELDQADDQQAAWDMEDLRVRLDNLAASIVAVDQATEVVRDLTVKLARAKRALHEAVLRQRLMARREQKRREPPEEDRL